MAKRGSQKAVQINYGKISEALGKEGLTARETSDLLGCNVWYLYQCKKRGVMAVESVKKLAELCNVPFETFLAEAATDEHVKNLGEIAKAVVADMEIFENEQSSSDTVDTDGEDTMTLWFSDNEFKRIEELTKHFKLNQTTKLFHKLLNDAWFTYRKEKLKDEVRRLSEEDLLKRYIASVFGTDKYDKEDLVRKIVDDAMRRYPNV